MAPSFLGPTSPARLRAGRLHASTGAEVGSGVRTARGEVVRRPPAAVRCLTLARGWWGEVVGRVARRGRSGGGPRPRLARRTAPHVDRPEPARRRAAAGITRARGASGSV